MATDFDGVIVTAHHRDDIIETVVMNLKRGSRWRGLAGMSDSQIVRPMNGWTKQRIYEYAIRQKLNGVKMRQIKATCIREINLGVR